MILADDYIKVRLMPWPRRCFAAGARHSISVSEYVVLLLLNWLNVQPTQNTVFELVVAAG